VARSLAYALLPVACGPGAAVQVEVDEEWAAAQVVRDPQYDPKGDRIRA
jgi:4-methylaminobutanoate oxidase (formaldehyde-forming)